MADRITLSFGGTIPYEACNQLYEILMNEDPPFIILGAGDMEQEMESRSGVEFYRCQFVAAENEGRPMVMSPGYDETEDNIYDGGVFDEVVRVLTDAGMTWRLEVPAHHDNYGDMEDGIVDLFAPPPAPFNGVAKIDAQGSAIIEIEEGDWFDPELSKRAIKAWMIVNWKVPAFYMADPTPHIPGLERHRPEAAAPT